MIYDKPIERSIPTIPCHNCITMAICNALMHRPEEKMGMNAWTVYKRCSTVKDYVDEHYVAQIDRSTWKTSLIAIQVYFKGADYTNPYVMSDVRPEDMECDLLTPVERV